MDSHKKRHEDKYLYMNRQRGFSLCHRTAYATIDNNNDVHTKKLVPSIMVENGEPDSIVEITTTTTYDSSYLNPSNTLDSAVAQNNAKLLEKLLTSTANISLEGLNASGGTPIHEAAYQGKLSCLKVFLKFGADVNLRDREGWTPLHAAICGGDVDSVILLLKQGSNINLTTNDGITPIDMALQSENEHISKAILQTQQTRIEKDGPAPLASMEEYGSDLSL